MPEALANKIAAGEVVQRPASALKELLENAIDAGAGDVEVILKSSGSELIQVVDDGCGMSPEDARACFRRHATSKIGSIEDLERLRTLGFRGEALASIGSVAQVELRTKRTSDAAGTCVRVEGGDMISVEPCATKDGTSIAVRNLFYNVPARRNFMKSPATELRHLVETFQSIALSYPSIGFRLIHDGMEMHRLPAESGGFGDALRGRLHSLFGAEYEDRLVKVGEKTSYLTVDGFVGQPELNKKSRGEQFLFVNGRHVRNRSLEHAVYSAFEGLIPDGSYPFFALFLSLDPSRVDVNVHPSKAEVKFDDEHGIYNFLKSIVRKGLGTALLAPQSGPETNRWSFDPMPFSQGAHDGDVGAGPIPIPHQKPGALSDQLYRPPESGGSSEKDDKVRGDDSLLWQLHERYILTQIRSGLMVLDQNAAHERILYERALQHIEEGIGMSQQLLFPQTVEFSAADYDLLRELMPDLRALGFDIEFFGGRSVMIRGVPSDIRSGDEKSILDDILAQYKLNRERLRTPRKDNLAKSLARRAAIRPGVRLSPREMRSLIDQLFACEMPYACPSGRPTMIKIPIEELDKRFSR